MIVLKKGVPTSFDDDISNTIKKGFIPLRAGGFNISSILFRLLPRWKTLPSIWDSSRRLSLGEVSWLSVKKPQHPGTSCIPDRRMSWARTTYRHRFSKAWQLHRLRQLLKTLVKDLSKWTKQKNFVLLRKHRDQFLIFKRDFPERDTLIQVFQANSFFSRKTSESLNSESKGVEVYPYEIWPFRENDKLTLQKSHKQQSNQFRGSTGPHKDN